MVVYVAAGWLLSLGLAILAWRRAATAVGTPAMTFAVLAVVAWLLGAVVVSMWLDGGRTEGGFVRGLGWATVPVVGMVGLAAAPTVACLVAAVRFRRERVLLRTLFPGWDRGARVGVHEAAGRSWLVRATLEKGHTRMRWLDGQRILLQCEVGPADISLAPPGPFGFEWPVLEEGPYRRVWLSPAVVEGVRRRAGMRIQGGVVELRRGEWLDEAGMRAAITDLLQLAETLWTSSLEAPARFAAWAVSSDDPAERRRAWTDLEAVSPDTLARLIDVGRADPDPLIRAVAAGAAGLAGEVTMRALLVDCLDADAVSRAAAWTAAHRRLELAPLLASRLGTPPDAAWPALVAALDVVGGTQEALALRMIVDGAGYSGALRQAAARVLGRIRASVDPGRAGGLALADALAETSGALAIVAEAGQLSVLEAEPPARGSERGRR